MSVSAAIYFTQGVSSSTPGVALIGSAGTSVTVANGNNTSIVRWVYNVVDVSSLSALTLPIVQDGPSPTFTFTPDAPGGYLLELTVYDSGGNFAVDYREFQVAEVTGRYIAAFKASDASLNFFIGVKQNLRGWATLMEPYLRLIDTLAIETFLDVVTDANNVSTVIVDNAHNQLVGFRNLSAPRSVTLPTTPQLGQRFAVVDKDGSCSFTTSITLNAGVLAIGTTTQTTFVFYNAYEGAIFEWTGQIWALLTHVNGPGLVGPGTAISTNYTLPANQTLLVFQDGPYVIDLHLIAPNREYVMLARGAGTLNGAGQVTLSSGSATFSIEDPQPTESGYALNTAGASPNRVTMRTDFATYRFALDTTANILRSIT